MNCAYHGDNPYPDCDGCLREELSRLSDDLVNSYETIKKAILLLREHARLENEHSTGSFGDNLNNAIDLLEKFYLK